jgi:hypothetical protein
MEFFDKKGVQVLENYPAQSCEFNVMEKVWSWMEPLVPLDSRNNKNDFETALVDAWENVRQESIDEFILHLPKICLKCLEAGGGHFKE